MPSSPTPVTGVPQCTSTVKPDTNGWVPFGTCGYVSRLYYPSFVAAVIFSAASGAVLLGHLAYRTRRPRLLHWPRVFISACLTSAYITRAIGTRFQQVTEFVAFSDTLVLISPLLIHAFNSMVLIKMWDISFPDVKLWAIRASSMSRTLALIMSLLLGEQLIASLLIAPKHTTSPEESRQRSYLAALGLQLYITGIGIQELLVLCTLGFAVSLHRMIHTASLASPEQGNVRWRPILYALYFSLGAISIRIAYRLIELSGFFTRKLQVLAHHEVFFYTLEALPVLVAVSVWTAVDMGCLDQASNRREKNGYRELGECMNEEAIPLARDED